MSHDVIVLGLGSMGSAAAAELAGRGARVLGLERFGAAHGEGSHHGDTRVIRQSYFEDPAYVPLLLRAYELWDALELATGRELITQTGGLYFGPPECGVVAGSLRSARAWDLPHDELDAADIVRRFPTMRPVAGEVGLFEARAGFVRPEATVAAQLELATSRGAELRFADAVASWSASASGCRVVTAAGAEHHADRLVITPGAWAPDLLADLGLPLRVTRQTLHWFKPRAGADAFALGHPVFIHEDAVGTQVYGFPAIDGLDGPVKVAFFRLGETTTAQSIDRTIRPEEIAALRTACDAFVPGLAGEHVRAVSCLYTNTPDEHFVLALHPDHANVAMGCGFSGHGFKFVPVVGEILADLTLHGATDHPIDLFDPRRQWYI